MDRDVFVLPTGERVTVLQHEPDVELEAVVPARCPGPPPHRHRWEEETFTVLEGTVRVRRGRERRDLAAGESAVVPPGVVHTFSNPTERPSRMRARVSPAGQLEAQLRLLAGSGRVPPILAMAVLNVEHDLSFELAGLPGVVQRPLWRALAAVGRLLGR